LKKSITDLMMKRFQDHQFELPAYNPQADFDWIRTQSGLPWLRLDIPVPHVMIAEEISKIQHLLTNHRDDYSEHQGWSSFCIHGKSHDATREDLFYNDDRPYTWTKEALDLMPNTVEYFRDYWPGIQFRRLRVMNLCPGGYISVHADSGSPGLNPINIAITQPDSCKFVFEKHGTVPFVQGQAFWLDVNKLHAVVNHSDVPRWHIIVHQNTNHPEFQKIVVSSYHSLYGHNSATN